MGGEGTIKEWKKDERPRERLMEKGAASLSDAELIAIILANGSKGESALGLARKILKSSSNNLRELSKVSFEKLSTIKGMGPAKICSILSLFELSKRYMISSAKELEGVTSSLNAAKIISPLLRDLNHEECWVLYLNRANKLIAKERMSIGGLTATVVDVKIIVRNALEKYASSIILAHNHPSGNAQPGENDRLQTQLLKEASAVFGITLLDHLIIAGDSYYSFSDEGLI